VVCAAWIEPGPDPGLAEPLSPRVLCAACAEAISKQPQPIPNFRLIRELGRGAMGVVYLALDAADDLVALKALLPAVAGTGVQVERFFREAEILQKLKHPHIISFRAMGEANGALYFAMDYVPGIDVGRAMRSAGAMPIGRAVRLICQLLEALEYAHGLGFVHRDVKPANILLVNEGPDEQVKLADFGLARVYQESQLSGLTLAGDCGGTIPFMAPEQITQFRAAKPQADLFSAAATLYHLLTGKYTYDFPVHPDQCLVLILNEDPVPIRSRRPDLPSSLSKVIHRGLLRDPAKRFADARAMRKALLPFLA
jgi:serine/threonine-protein kinase